MKQLLLLILAVLGLQAIAAQPDRFWRVSNACSYNPNQDNPSITSVANCNYIRLHIIPAMPGQQETIMIDLQERQQESGTSKLPILWFTKGKSSYDYTYVNDNGQTYRILIIYSSDFGNSYLGITIANNYSGGCNVVYMNEDTSKCTEVTIEGSQGEQFFKTVSRLVRDIGFTKKRSDTLYIDVDF